MPQVQPIDAVTEHRLLGALTDVSNHVADGDDPNEAICKVASVKQLTPGQTELVIRAYNTGRTQFQFSNGDTLAEKLASFPLADPAVVLGKLYPKQVKTAAQERRDTAIASDYSASPRSWLQKVAMEEKAASGADLVTKARREFKLAHASGRIDHSVDEQHTKFLAAKQAAENAKLAVSRAKYAAHTSLMELTNYFKQANALPLDDVRDNACMAYPRATRLLDAVEAELPQHGTFTEELDKLAGKTCQKKPKRMRRKMAHLVNWNAAPYSLILDCLKKTAEYAQADDAANAAEKTAKEVSDVFLGPFLPASPVDVITGSVWADPSSPTKEAGWLTPALSATVGSTAGSLVKNLTDSISGQRESAIKGQLGKLQSPQHEQELRTIRTQSMLADMLQNDPVISSYPQDHVLDAYSRLSEVAPQAVQHRVLAQSMLRKYLEQGSNLADFDVDQMLGIENKLRPPQQQTPAPAAK